MKRTLFLTSLVLVLFCGDMANSQVRIGNPPDNTDQDAPVPMQTYAVIDISGNKSSDVKRVALNDANQAAFGFESGTDPSDLSGTRAAEFRVCTWQNGKLSPDAVTPLYSDNGYYDNHFGYTGESWTHYGVSALLASGKVCGEGETCVYGINQDKTFDFTTGNIMVAKAMFGVGYDNTPKPFDVPVYDISLGAFPDKLTEKNGTFMGHFYVARNGDIFNSFGVSFLYVPDSTSNGTPGNTPSGKWVMFSSEQSPDWTNIPANISLQNGDFIVGDKRCLNKNGWFVASTADAIPTGVLWKGSPPLEYLSDGVGICLNDQNQFVAASFSGGEGYLWENGNKVVLAKDTKFPKALKGQVKNIQPYLISNQVAPGSDATINIVATAQDNGNNVTLICTRDNAGIWSFAEVQLPDGVSISGGFIDINSSGIVAAIGNAGTGDGHALLLLPVRFKLLNGDTTSTDVDGVDFFGNRPTTRDWGYLATDNTTTANVIGTLHTNILGILPLNNSYAAGATVNSILMESKVAPSSTGFAYSWHRSYRDCSTTIIRSGSTWNVASVNDSHNPTQQSDDTGSSNFFTTLVSPKDLLYYADAPGANLASSFNTCNVGDFAYEQTDFTYTLTITIGPAIAVKTIHVGQVIIAKRIATTGDVQGQWSVQQNTVTTTNIPTCQVTTAQVDAIVGGTPTVSIDPAVNGNLYQE